MKTSVVVVLVLFMVSGCSQDGANKIAILAFVKQVTDSTGAGSYRPGADR